MMPTPIESQVPVPPPAYHRAQARGRNSLHIDALTLVRSLHLLTLCRQAVRLAQWRCPPPLPAGPSGAPRRYSEESLLLIALVRTLWRLSYQDVADLIGNEEELNLLLRVCIAADVSICWKGTDKTKTSWVELCVSDFEHPVFQVTAS